MSALGYNTETVERIDKLAFWLYCIPVKERKEILDVLRYQFSIEDYKNERFDEILANRK